VFWGVGVKLLAGIRGMCCSDWGSCDGGRVRGNGSLGDDSVKSEVYI